MKKKFYLLLIGTTLSLTGCGSSVSFEDYSTKVEELEILQENYDSKVNELEVLQANYDTNLKELTAAQKEIKDLQNKYEKEHEKLVNLQTELDSMSNAKTEPDEQQESIQFFEEVYLPYANREKPFIYEAVKTFANSCEYETEIVGATEDTNASITITSPNGDYVNFIFSPINDIDMIMIVSFYHASTNSEVSLSNYSPDGSASYDTYTTHVIGEKPQDVNGTDQQRNFLFKK